MKDDTINKLFAVILIACAFYTFDHTSFNKIGVSILLAFNGINAFVLDSQSDTARAVSKWCRRAMYLVMFILITKLLIGIFD